MAVGVTILRVGVLAFVVGQACASPARPTTVAVAPPDLLVPPLDPRGAAAHDPTPGDGVRFGHPLPVVGAAWRVSVRASSHAADPQGGEALSTYESDFRAEITAIDGPAPARVHLRFLRNVQTFQGAETPTVLHGKEYVVDARAPHVRTSAEVAAPPDETQRVRDVFPDLGTRARIDEVLPDEAMRLGDRRDELAAAVLRVIHPRAWTLHAGTATLARVEGEHAVFTLTLDTSSEGGLHMKLAGEARVRLADSRLSDLALDGPYESKSAPSSSSGGAGNAPETSGTFSLRRTVTSDPASRSDR